MVLQQKINKCFWMWSSAKVSSSCCTLVWKGYFLPLIPDPSESHYRCLHIFGNWLSLHCKEAAWMIPPQPEMSASWNIPGENKGHSWLGGRWSRRNLHLFDIYILLCSFCLFENSLNLLPQAEEWDLNFKEKREPALKMESRIRN